MRGHEEILQSFLLTMASYFQLNSLVTFQMKRELKLFNRGPRHFANVQNDCIKIITVWGYRETMS